MPDPYSSLGEGLSRGMQMGSMIQDNRRKKEEAQREEAKAKFDNMRKNLDTFANVLKSDAPMQIRQAAANGMLGIYKAHGADMGLDPTQLPSKIEFDDDMADMFANKILSMNKLYEKKLIGRNDYRVGMFQLAGEYKNKTGKENPDIMKTADAIADKDRKIIDAVIGDRKVKLQETDPGSGNFAPMMIDGQEVSGPAAQRVEVVKPPTEGEREKISNFKADITELMELRTSMPKELVGPVASKFTSAQEFFDTLSPEENEWLATLDIKEAQLKKFYAGTAQSKQELQSLMKAVPNRKMAPNKLTGALDATIKNYNRKYKEMRDTLLKAGIKDPDGLPMTKQLQLYKQAKSGKKTEIPDAGGGKVPLSAIFFSNPDTEEENP